MLNENKMSITEKVMDYQKTGMGYEQLCTELSLKAYFYPRRKWGWDQDMGSAFFLYMYPAIGRSIRAYADRGLSFEHYFNSLLYWQRRAFLRKHQAQDNKWQCTMQEDFWDFAYQSELERERGRAFRLERVFKMLNHKICSEAEQRQFLYYVLKKSLTMTDENINYICSVTDYAPDYVSGLVEQLRESLHSQERRLKIQQQRKYTAFAKIRFLASVLAREYDEEKKLLMQGKLDKLRKMYALACRIISRIRLTPTQAAIAAAAGVPKGTVDSAIFAFKKKVSAM